MQLIWIAIIVLLVLLAATLAGIWYVFVRRQTTIGRLEASIKRNQRKDGEKEYERGLRELSKELKSSINANQKKIDELKRE